MARYFASVELKGKPSPETCEALHLAMAKQQFVRKVITTSGELDMPRATYWCENSPFGVEEVYKMINDIVLSIQKESNLAVVQVAEAKFLNTQ